ncbi:serine O-acetyltransferase [Aureimonas pseudogalii]|jgi:serine O-acetyltransferase|uniref:Serine acetyltransferase n=1 Tax=Aureimonas pseudogalii TaxID=1744844 RepID=A0A7W6H413_9HYPH|nr:serine O-acetyltransferase [Aureimonas pseudogalii]MBB3998315.1 serine O-acetyltransferase [Aureimonas pseudogalii]
MTALGLTHPDRLAALDPIWLRIQDEARAASDNEPVLSALLYSSVLNQKSLEAAVAHRISQRLDHADLPACHIEQAFDEMATASSEWGGILRTDLQAVFDRDPACERMLEPLLYFKGFHAIQTHRLAHWLWHGGRRDFALYLQSRSSAAFQTDIHPASRMGRGIFLDHATGLVVGFTAVIGNNVSILQNVTLGGTGKEFGDRHPKIGNGVLIGAGAKILGNIRVGDCSKVASGSVVLKEVPPNSTVAGIPAKIIGTSGCAEPARAMNHDFSRTE